MLRLTTTASVLVFAGWALGNLVHHEHITRDMLVMGYPLYFMTVLGLWKLLGAIAVAVPGVPRLKEWAYAGMVFDLTGAAVSRGSSGFGATHVFIPLVLCIVVLTSWALRPASRRALRPQRRLASPHGRGPSAPVPPRGVPARGEKGGRRPPQRAAHPARSDRPGLRPDAQTKTTSGIVAEFATTSSVLLRCLQVMRAR